MNPFDEVLSMVGHGYKLKYICAALDRIRHCTIDPDEHTAVAQAERMIRNRLGNYVSMEGWLMAEVPGYREAYFNARSYAPGRVGKEPGIVRQTRAHRLQWLQQLKVEWDNGVRR